MGASTAGATLLAKTGKSATALASGLAELLWPERCAICDLPGTVLCGECEAALPYIDYDTACQYCCAPYGWLACTECDTCADDDVSAEPDADARSASAPAAPIAPLASPFSFSRSRSVCEYRDGAARLVKIYKDAGERRLAPVLARLLGGALDAQWLEWVEVVAYIPATPAAKKRRGFDHMRLLAECLSRAYRLPLSHALCRRDAHDQRELTRSERIANARDSFYVDASQSPHEGARVLLLDDVFTTGATLSAAANVLLEFIGRDVRAMTFARVW